MEITVDWEEFESRMNNQLIKGESLIDANKKYTQEDFELLEKQIQAWREDLADIITNSFEGQEAVKKANKIKTNPAARNSGTNRQPPKSVGALRDNIKDTVSDTKYLLKELSVCDAIIKKEQIDLEERLNYTVEETMDLLLEKLFEIYDDKRYDAAIIFKGNGIKFSRRDEAFYIVKKLKDMGYIHGIMNTDAQLTLDGKMYIENKRKALSVTYEGMFNVDNANLVSKIDDIKSKLDELGLGQEVIFAELDSLKAYVGKIDKKSLAQLLKGKVVDLMLGQLISGDTAKAIYKEFTSSMLLLP